MKKNMLSTIIKTQHKHINNEINVLSVNVNKQHKKNYCYKNSYKN